NGLDGVRWRELGRIDDADLRHIQSAGDTRHAGGEHEHHEFMVLDPITEETITRATRNMMANVATVTTNSDTRVLDACTLKPRMSLKSVRPLLPPNPKLLRKNPSCSATVSAWVMIDR